MAAGLFLFLSSRWLSRSAVSVSVNRCTRAATAANFNAADQGVHGTDSHDCDYDNLQPEFSCVTHNFVSHVCATRLNSSTLCRR